MGRYINERWCVSLQCTCSCATCYLVHSSHSNYQNSDSKPTISSKLQIKCVDISCECWLYSQEFRKQKFGIPHPLQLESPHSCPSWVDPMYDVCVCEVKVLVPVSHVQLFVTPWTVALQAPLSIEFPGKNTEAGCHSLLQGIFLNQGSNLGLLHCR